MNREIPEFNLDGSRNQKEVLRGHIKQCVHGASFDGIQTESQGDYYQLCSDLLKIVEALTVKELLEITRPVRANLSYCSVCQRGFKDELMIKGFCPWDFNDWCTTLNEMDLKINPNTIGTPENLEEDN